MDDAGSCATLAECLDEKLIVWIKSAALPNIARGGRTPMLSPQDAGWLQLLCCLCCVWASPRPPRWHHTRTPLSTDLRNLQPETLIKVFHLALGLDKSRRAVWILTGCAYYSNIAQWASPLLLLGRSHFYRFIQIFLKFSKIYDQILKIFVQNWPDQSLVKE